MPDPMPIGSGPCRTVLHDAARFARLVGFAALLLARPLPRQRLLGAAAITRLQVEGVLLDILDDIFLLHLPLEPAKRAFDGLAILHFHFSQARIHPLRGRLHPSSRGATCSSLWAFRIRRNTLGYHRSY